MKHNILIEPFEAVGKYKNLFTMLGYIYNIHFSEVPKNIRNPSAPIIQFGGKLDCNKKCLYYPFPNDSMSISGDYISFSQTDHLDKRLHNAAIYDDFANSLRSLKPYNYDVHLADVKGEPIWVKSFSKNSETDIVSLSPFELNNADSFPGIQTDSFNEFWNSFRFFYNEKRFFSMVPIIHFIRECVGSNDWLINNKKACFVVDDPNIRFTSYGNIKYNQVIKEAKNHNFHLSIATIPLDLFWASNKAAKLVRDNSEFISLSIHGNNHTKEELFSNDHISTQYIAQALNRISRFEQRYRIPISKVFIAPHETFSYDMSKAMISLGVEGICNSRTFGWKDKETNLPLNQQLHTGFFPFDTIAGGLPVITRRGLTSDVHLRSFLDQPIIIYFHQNDLSKDLDELIKASKMVNSLGNYEWLSLSDILNQTYASKEEGDLLRIRLFSRSARVSTSKGFKNVQIELPLPQGDKFSDKLFINGKFIETFHENYFIKSIIFHLNDQNNNVDLKLIPNAFIDPKAVRPLRFTLFPYLRRFATEFRDRFISFA